MGLIKQKGDRFVSRSSTWVAGYTLMFAVLFAVALEGSSSRTDYIFLGLLIAICLILSARAFTSFSVTVGESVLTVKTLYRTRSFRYDDLDGVEAVEGSVRFYARVYVKYVTRSGGVYRATAINDSPRNRASIDALVQQIRSRMVQSGHSHTQ